MMRKRERYVERGRGKDKYRLREKERYILMRKRERYVERGRGKDSAPREIYLSIILIDFD